MNNLITTLQSLFATAEVKISPLVFDLNGNGVETLSKSAGIHFDLDNNGFAEQTGWAAPTDGLLVRDKNGNGKIDNGGELFGNNTLLSTGAKAANGFAALSELDTNHDGKVDSLDASFASLRVWKDANSNAVTDSGELIALADAGVQSINVGYTTSSAVDAQGNALRQIGQYTGVDGLAHAVDDVWFGTDMARSVDLNPVAVNDTIAALPELQGFGNVHSLHQAMARDAGGHLQALVASFAATTDLTARKALVITIIYAWAGVENVDPASRGPYIDARELGALETFLGESFAQFGSSSPSPGAAGILQQTFDQLLAYVDGQLMAQTQLKPLYDSIGLAWDAASGSFKLDVSATVALLQSEYAVDATGTLQQMRDFAVSLKVDGQAGLDILGQLQQSSSLTGDSFAFQLATMGYTVLQGDAGNNTLTAADGSDIMLLGMGGNDTLNGNAGNDTLDGGAGNDTLNGGAGNDTYIFGTGSGQDTIYDYDYTAGNLDTVRLTDLNLADVTVVRELNASGNSTNLLIKVNGTTDQLRVSNQYTDPCYQIEKLVFADGTTWGVNEFNTAPFILTAAGTAQGTALGDSMTGSTGNDTLNGNAGNDTLDGGAGNDTLNGGTGNDTYLFGRGYGQDTINEADSTAGNVDTIRLIGLNPSDVTVIRELNSSGTSTNLLINVNGTTDQLRVVNQYTDPYYQIEKLVFADGTTWGLTEFNTLPLIATGVTANGTNGADTLDLRNTANSTANGGTGNDTYLFGKGSGQDTINEADYTAGNLDTIRLTGLNLADVTVVREFDASGNSTNLLIKVNGTTDQLRVVNQYNTASYGTYCQVEKLVFADGTTWGMNELNTLPILATGTAANGTSGADTFDLRNAVNTTANGGTGNDTYLFGRGYGQDTINEADYTAGNLDTIRLIDLNLADVTVVREFDASGNSTNLLIKVNGTTDQLRVVNQYNTASYGTYCQVEKLVFADGTTWGINELNTLPILATGAVANGTSGADTFDLRNAVNTTANGGAGNDTYLFGAGSGQDTIYDYDSTAGNLDTIRLTDLNLADVTVVRELNASGNSTNLLIKVNGTTDQLRLQNQYNTASYGTYCQVEKLVFADGTTWGITELNMVPFVLTAAGTAQGTALNDTINGSSGNDTLYGNAGNDILQGSAGNDTLNDTAGNNMLDGGAGDDALTGNAGNEFFAGGTGNDILTTGNGADIIAFNRGNGQDILYGGVGKDNTISLGGGIQYSDLALSKAGNDLILETGNNEQITLKNWYDTSANYKSVLDLQVVADAMAAFDQASTDPMLNKAIQEFDFTAIANAFDQARGANSTFMHWSALNTLLLAHLSASDSAALGGDLAHQYGMSGTFAGMNLASAQGAINDAQFGTQVQALHPLQGLQGGAMSLG